MHAHTVDSNLRWQRRGRLQGRSATHAAATAVTTFCPHFRPHCCRHCPHVVPLPQAPERQAHAACSNKRACVTSLPTRVAHGLVWVWPGGAGWDSGFRGSSELGVEGGGGGVCVCRFRVLTSARTKSRFKVSGVEISPMVYWHASLDRTPPDPHTRNHTRTPSSLSLLYAASHTAAMLTHALQTHLRTAGRQVQPCQWLRRAPHRLRTLGA